MSRGCIDSIIQQPETKLTLPYWWYRPRCQLVCALLLTTVFIATGAGLLLRANSLYEVKVSYNSIDTRVVFTVEQDIGPNALVYYELPGVNMNRKDFIESKDARAYTTLLNKVACTRSDNFAWAKLRRDDNLTQRMNPNSADIAPCGLVALSMFTDRFAFFSKDPANAAKWIALDADESEVALPADVKAFDKKITPSGGKLMIGGVTSWIEPGLFFEHWKVWYRTPAAPHVRNLWAVIKNGVPRGDYAVEFVENSQIWEDWGVPLKNIIIAQRDTFGNQGAIRVLGGVCIAIGTFEFLACLLFVILACFDVKKARKGKPYQATETE